MKKNAFFYFLPVLFLISCIKHEIIPAPKQTVVLTSSFRGVIGGTDIKWLQNVDDYTCTPSQDKLITSSSDKLNSAIYKSKISSVSKSGEISIALGSIYWIKTNDAFATKKLFTDFFDTFKTNPIAYSVGAKYGFEVQYKDNAGTVWVSDSASIFPQNATITNINYDSDINIDYCMFNLTFNCRLYHLNPETKNNDFLEVENAVFKGWFTRQ
jgi:hypothetical protein